ncbi:MAG: hypothetical protein IPM18_03755 [Phycisphaerales bacterium]|nr:hypothetical protein [Phycisphaerales bacterium]
MTAVEAKAAVQAARHQLELDDEFAPVAAERALVPCAGDGARAKPVEHRVAWIVTLSSAWGFAEVRVDDVTGKILDVVRSA